MSIKVHSRVADGGAAVLRDCTRSLADAKAQATGGHNWPRHKVTLNPAPR
ncbi:MAG: hypothetical protein O2948_07040 [Proteobacteria bacterium]|nr:hypothetical protein [Pseudomonadota bacterium]MDA0926806.1 hypothetical protein [Pseudomonadota bacterium]